MARCWPANGHSGWARAGAWATAGAVAFSGALAALIAVYKLLPPVDLSWAPALKAASGAAVAIAALTLGFIGYLRLGADFEGRYATSTLAGMVLLAAWLFLANWVILIAFRAALPDDQTDA